MSARERRTGCGRGVAAVRSRAGILVILSVALGVSGGCCAPASTAGRAGMLDDLPRLTGGRPQRAKLVTDLQPGQVLRIADLEGPGVIRHIWFTARGGGERLYKDLVLRIWWDGEDLPSVELPLGDFFGVGWGEERMLRTLPVEMIPAVLPNHAALNCWWPMPFRVARVEVEHQGIGRVELFFCIINWERVAALPEDWGRFHAMWRRQDPVPRGGPYTILEAAGCGRYVGTIMNYHILEPGSWVEGGEDFYIDNAAGVSEGGEASEPTLAGIGSEDYFGLAWGYRPEFNTLSHGTSFGPQGGRMTAYRFHILDPIQFQRRIRVTMRCHGWDVQARSDDYSSVAVWYQSEPHKAFPPLPPVEARVPADLDAARVERP